MSLIALFSDKGSPGTTTLALALAASWPRPVLLAELDPAGGDLALRLTDTAARPILTAAPGLLSLAAACRTGHPVQAGEHAQPLPFSNVAVMPGLATGEQGSAMVSLWPAVADALAAQAGTGDVLADLGRLQSGSPALAVADRADVLLGVGRADAEGMLRLRDRMTHLLASLSGPSLARRAVVVLVGEDRRAGEAVTAMRTVLEHAALQVEVAGCVALDTDAVEDLHRGRVTARTQRTLLVRGVRSLLPSLGVGDATITADQPHARRRGLAGSVR